MTLDRSKMHRNDSVFTADCFTHGVTMVTRNETRRVDVPKCSVSREAWKSNGFDDKKF